MNSPGSTRPGIVPQDEPTALARQIYRHHIEPQMGPAATVLVTPATREAAHSVQLNAPDGFARRAQAARPAHLDLDEDQHAGPPDHQIDLALGTPPPAREAFIAAELVETERHPFGQQAFLSSIHRDRRFRE